jgi:hypothetical protein
MIGYTYAQLLQSLQDWPVNQGSNYIGNIPRYVELGELRLVRDLNLEIFDQTDSSFVLLAGHSIITKPDKLVSLRTLRLASITGTTSVNANVSSICASQNSSYNLSPLSITGIVPHSLIPAQQVTATETLNSSGGINVVIVGLDVNGNAYTETIVTIAGGVTVASVERFSSVISVSTSNGSIASPSKMLEIGNAAVAQSTLGPGFPLYKRNWDYVQNFAADPAVTAPPRYYAETDSNTWAVAQAADQSYAAVVRYIKRPQTIVTAGTSWLGDRCGDLLFLASLMEAEFYLKADDRFTDLQGDYQSKLQVARVELRNSIRQGDYEPMKAAAATVQG